MTEIYTWADFKRISSELNAASRNELIFRGHGSDEWSLDTTLDRSNHSDTIESYYRLILGIKSEVQAYTELTWDDDPNFHSLMERLGQDYDPFSRFFMGGVPHYAYMAYLRHHGFPSPLLDWSSSPYVAAYFAFADQVGTTDNVAIFAYRERGEHRMKIGGSDDPSIMQLGPYVAGPKRHFAQRSQYTICTHWNSGIPSFWSHDAVCQTFDQKAEFQQDIIYKFRLPRTERAQVLRELAAYNLNAFTLFGSEESLMQALSQREELA
jgi:hypothetical protein